MIDVSDRALPPTINQKPQVSWSDKVGKMSEMMGSSQAAPAAEQVATPQDVAQQPAPNPESQRIAMLARRERMIRQQSRQVQAEKQALAAQKAEIEQYRTWKSTMATDPLKVFQEAGVPYDRLVDGIVNQPSPQDQKLLALEQRLIQEQTEREALKRQIEESDKLRYAESENQLQYQIDTLVDSDPRFEATKSMGASGVVMEFIKQHFEDTRKKSPRGVGVVMDIDEAASIVEDYLLDNNVMPLMKLSKVQQRLNKAQAPQQPQNPVKQNPFARQSTKRPETTISAATMQPSSKPSSWAETRQKILDRLAGQQSGA